MIRLYHYPCSWGIVQGLQGSLEPQPAVASQSRRRIWLGRHPSRKTSADVRFQPGKSPCAAGFARSYETWNCRRKIARPRKRSSVSFPSMAAVCECATAVMKRVAHAASIVTSCSPVSLFASWPLRVRFLESSKPVGESYVCNTCPFKENSCRSFVHPLSALPLPSPW